MDRILQLELLGENFQMPDDFNTREYLDAEFKDQPMVSAKLRFIADAAHIVKSNLSNWDSFNERPDGSMDVVVAAPDLYWLASMVLGFANWVTVLDPPELRLMVKDWARETARLYQDDSS